MFNVLLRAVFLFFLVFITIRLMGKRQVGELQPYEFVVAMMTADLATIPMSDLSIPLLWGIIGVLSLSALQLLISFISLKSRARAQMALRHTEHSHFTRFDSGRNPEKTAL